MFLYECMAVHKCVISPVCRPREFYFPSACIDF